MTTPSSPGSSGTAPEPGGDETLGGDAVNRRAQTADALGDIGSVSATPVVLDGDDDTEDYDDEMGGRTALDLDAPARGARQRRGAPLDLSSLIGQFEADQERARRGATSVPAQSPAQPSQPAQSATSESVTRPQASGGEGDDSAEIARLRGDLDAERGSLRRAQADLVNGRRKAEQERTRAVQDATERVIRQFFPLFDDFERGLITTRESRSYDQLATGVDGILRNADALLARYGVQPTEALGKMFDPTLHEAIGVVETTEEPEETIVEELRKGYTLGDRLLRAAMVRVARRPAAAAEPASFENADTDVELDDAAALDVEP